MDIETHQFFGTSSDFAVIVAGIHGTEQSGIEVAHWIHVKLANRPNPTRLSAIVIPDLFRDRNTGARSIEWKNGVATGDQWRELVDGKTTLYPARMFPPPGKPLSFLGSDKRLKDDLGHDLTVKGVSKITIRPEIEYLIRIIETVKPVRIVSVHGTIQPGTETLTNAKAANAIDWTDDQITKWDGKPVKGVNFTGIFVDPRYTPSASCQKKFDVESCKFDPTLDPAFPLEGKAADKRFDSATTADGRADDAIALKTAQAVYAIDNTLVPGNHLDDKPEVVHYAKPRNTPQAYSLGDWGPVEVNTRGGAPGARPGAPVFTIETKDNQESWAFLDGIQYMSEDSKELIQPPLPAERAVGKRGRSYARPAKFNAGRSKALQAYAEGIIDTILELP